MVTLTDISCLQQVKKFNNNTHTHTHTHTHTQYLHHHHDKGSKLVSTSHKTLASVHHFIITYKHTHTQMIFIHYTNNNNKNHNKYVERVATNNILKVTGIASPHSDYLHFLA